jgi:hypothetical protein
MAQKIIVAMNETMDSDLIKVYTDALNELGVKYLYDSYVGWILTDGYTKSELSHMKEA